MVHAFINGSAFPLWIPKANEAVSQQRSQPLRPVQTSPTWRCAGGEWTLQGSSWLRVTPLKAPIATDGFKHRSASPSTGVLPRAGAKRFPWVERATEVATSLRHLASGLPWAPPRGGAKQSSHHLLYTSLHCTGAWSWAIFRATSPEARFLSATKLPSPPEGGKAAHVPHTCGGVSRHRGGGLGSLRPGPSPAGSLAEGGDQSREADSFSAG